MEFLKKDIAARLDAKPSKIQYYTDTGLIIPDIYAGSGRGSRRIYSKRNIFEILITQRLVGMGFQLHQVKTVLAILRAHHFGVTLSGQRFPDNTFDSPYWDMEQWPSDNNAFLEIVYSEGMSLHNVGIFFLDNTGIRVQKKEVKYPVNLETALAIKVSDLKDKVTKI